MLISCCRSLEGLARRISARQLTLKFSHIGPHQKMGNIMKVYLALFVFANLLLLSGCGKEGEAGKVASASLVNARKLYDAGQFRSARIEIEAAIKADPKVSDAHFLAGQIAEKLGNPEAALNEYVAADA